MLTNRVITAAQYRSAVRVKSLGLKPGNIYTQIKQPYFFSYVTDQLIDEYGAGTVREGGLKVYTTIDPRLQRLANKAIRDILPYRTDPAAAIVSVEPGTGAIRAMTAVVRNAGNQFNLAAQSARQAGSTFKTFVLASAVEQGVDPNSTYYTSAPFTCNVAPWCDPAKPWEVHTYDNTYNGSESITRATLQSDNTVYAQLTLDVGPRYVWQMAHRLGVHLTPDKPVASIGLGSLAVSPLDMAAAYATFPAMGVYAKPMAITKVVLPTGKVDTASGWGRPRTKRALSEGVAWQVTDVLRQNAEYGTGAGSGDGVHPNAGKTGTTENHADAWFDGFTRQLSTVVWMGYQQGEIPMTNVHGEEVAGATFPVPIWHEYMAAALWKRPALDFLVPDVYPTFRPIRHGDYGYLQYVSPPVSTTTARRRRRRRPRPRRPSPPTRRRLRRARRRSRIRSALVAGCLTLTLVVACVFVARLSHVGTVFLVLLAGAFASYVVGYWLLRRGGRFGLVFAVACAIQLAPLAAPLLLSTDALTYWSYARLHDPYRQTPADDPVSASHAGRAYLHSTSAYGPAFTLLSKPVGLTRSPSVAGWTFRVTAALAVLLATFLASRRRASAAALVGWNPIVAVHFAGGGHNDALMVALVAVALALGDRGSTPRCRRRLGSRRTREVGAAAPVAAACARGTRLRPARRPSCVCRHRIRHARGRNRPVAASTGCTRLRHSRTTCSGGLRTRCRRGCICRPGCSWSRTRSPTAGCSSRLRAAVRVSGSRGCCFCCASRI